MLDGFGEDVSAVFVFHFCTTWLRTGEVPPLKFVSPLKAAVMLWVPRLSEEVENVAIPPPFNAELESIVVPSRKATVPVGVPLVAELTVAVNATG